MVQSVALALIFVILLFESLASTSVQLFVILVRNIRDLVPPLALFFNLLFIWALIFFI